MRRPMGLGERRFFENILEPSKSIFFKGGPLMGGEGIQWTFIDELKKGDGGDAFL